MGYKINIPKFKQYYKSQREQSFNYMGPKIFNSLPAKLRLNVGNLEKWKHELDLFLENIPDNPITAKISSGLCDPYTSKPTNSITRWIPFLGLSGRRPDNNSNI